MTPYLVPCLVVFRNELNAMFPKRDKRSDGWIGDDSHATRFSSHNPTDSGAVRAIDIDVDDNDPNKDIRLTVIEAAMRDPRVWYIISNGIIWSRTHGWKARKYLGSNQHFGHVHVSVVEDPKAWRDASRWIEPVVKKWTWNPEVKSELAKVQQEFQKKAGVLEGAPKRYHGTAGIQHALNVKAGANLEVNGWVDAATMRAWRAYEAKHGGTGRLTTPDPKSLGPEGLQIMYRFVGPETK